MFSDPLIIDHVLKPFPHFQTHAVFADEELLKALGQWLHSSRNWALETGQFYEQYGFDFSAHPLSEEARFLTSPRAISTLLKISERAFGTSFFPAVVITAHKLVPGQYINVHTDASKASQTHRLVVQIPSPEQPEGG